MKREHLKEILAELKIPIAYENSEGWMYAMCPFAKWTHAGGTDARPAFSARASTKKKSGYNCFSCKMSGNISSLVRGLEHFRGRKYKGLAIRADLREHDAGIGGEFERELVREKQEPLNEKAFGDLYAPAWRIKRAREYLKERGISRETVEVLDLRWDGDEKRVLFPVRDRKHRLYGFTGRTILDKEDWPGVWYGKVRDYAGLRKDQNLLGAQLVDTNRRFPILLVEGLFAESHFIEVGADALGNVVGSLGSSISGKQIDTLEDWGKPVYVFWDNDETGRKGMDGYESDSGRRIKGCLELLRKRVPTYKVPWLRGWEDPDELEFRHIQEMMKRAKLVH